MDNLVEYAVVLVFGLWPPILTDADWVLLPDQVAKGAVGIPPRAQVG
jgi:hypothetical protein